MPDSTTINIPIFIIKLESELSSACNIAIGANEDGNTYAKDPHIVVVMHKACGLRLGETIAMLAATPVIIVIVDTLDEKFVRTHVPNANKSTTSIVDELSIIGLSLRITKSFRPTPSLDTALPNNTPIDIKNIVAHEIFLFISSFKSIRGLLSILIKASKITAKKAQKVIEYFLTS